MGRSLWEAFLSIFDRGSNENDVKDEEGVAPSPLDLSVRFAHGGPDTEVERELVDIEEQARELEDTHHDK